MRLLRGRDNPFSSLVARPGLDQGFLDTHVPGILADERSQLEAAIARYRVPTYNRAADIPETRAVVVRGARGAGKTHLLRALAYSEGLSPLIVRPSAFDPAVPFEELVLADFVRALCEPDEIHGSRFIDDLATWLGRRLLRQALIALGPADRVYALAPSRWQRFRWLGGGAEAHSKRFDHLAKALGSGGTPVADLLRAHGVSNETALRLVVGHLRRHDDGDRLLPSIRRSLLEGMARALLGGDTAALDDCLNHEAADGRPVTRHLYAVTKIHALVECCALVQAPVVIAFDNFEGLLGPDGTYPAERTTTFFRGAAQFIDATRGVLLLMFVEDGVYEEHLWPRLDEFVQHRLFQGVPVGERGLLTTLHLPRPGAAAARALIGARVSSLLKGLPEASPVGEDFPFSAEFLQRLESPTERPESVRLLLYRLRDEYNRVVFGDSPSAVPAVTSVVPEARSVDWGSWFRECWDREYPVAPDPADVHRVSLHAAITRWLELVGAAGFGGWRVEGTTKDVDEDNRYATVTVLDATGADGPPRRAALGFLLAGGAGMPNDLKGKFSSFRALAPAPSQLVILWRTEREGEDVPALLPPRTAEVWRGTARKANTSLQRMNASEGRAILAAGRWLQSVRGHDAGPPPTGPMGEFLSDKLSFLVRAIKAALRSEGEL